MQTRQELILEFMKTLSVNYHAHRPSPDEDDESTARRIYLRAAILADMYLNRI